MRGLSLCSSIVFSCIAIVGPAEAETMAGAWSGTGLERNVGHTPHIYPIEMTLQENNGTIEYPSLKCGGTLTRKPGESAISGYDQFVENIDHGSKCASGGTVYVKLEHGRLIWFWGDFAAIAVLDRKK